MVHLCVWPIFGTLSHFLDRPFWHLDMTVWVHTCILKTIAVNLLKFSLGMKGIIAKVFPIYFMNYTDFGSYAHNWTLGCRGQEYTKFRNCYHPTCHDTSHSSCTSNDSSFILGDTKIFILDINIFITRST